MNNVWAGVDYSAFNCREINVNYFLQLYNAKLLNTN